jgi:hypothetical protein
MRTKWTSLTLTLAVATWLGCSDSLKVPRRDGGGDVSPTGSGDGALAATSPDTAVDAPAAMPDAPFATGGADGHAEAATPPDAAEPDGGNAGIQDAWPTPVEAGADTNTIPWPGPDASVVFPGSPASLDGGVYPQVYAFPGVALASHSPMFPSEPDLSFTAQEVGRYGYADLNSDGLGDLLIARGTSLSFYLQTAAGGFLPIHGITLEANDYCQRYVVADFNRDGLADLAMVHYPDPSGKWEDIAVFLQSPEGFPNTPDQEIATVFESNVLCNQTYSLVATDMNQDGRPDLVAMTATEHNYDPGAECWFDAGDAQVFLQGADGQFALRAAFSPRGDDAVCKVCGTVLGVADFSGDGQQDLVFIQNGQQTAFAASFPGREVLVYPRTVGGFANPPAQVLTVSQYIKALSFVDANGDGRLDILARSADWGLASIDSRQAGLSSLFLQKADGSFDMARNIAPDGWLPAGTDPTKDPVGIDVRDVDLDGVNDLVLDRRSAAEGLFRQERGLFATTPDAEIQAVLAEWVRGANEKIIVTYAIDKGTATVTERLNRLSYGIADMNGDGRPDIVAAYQPFAPTIAPDPVTGVYPSYPGMQANTYTQFRVYLQRPLTSRLVVEIQQSKVSVDEKLLRIRATVHNLATRPATEVRIRVLAAQSPVMMSTTHGILASGPDGMAAFGADWVSREENAVHGDPLGPDLVIPRIEADETVPLAIDVPVALVPDLDVRCVFLVVQPDENINVILRRKYDFIAPN